MTCHLLTIESTRYAVLADLFAVETLGAGSEPEEDSLPLVFQGSNPLVAYLRLTVLFVAKVRPERDLNPRHNRDRVV